MIKFTREKLVNGRDYLYKKFSNYIAPIYSFGTIVAKFGNNMSINLQSFTMSLSQ